MKQLLVMRVLLLNIFVILYATDVAFAMGPRMKNKCDPGTHRMEIEYCKDNGKWEQECTGPVTDATELCERISSSLPLIRTSPTTVTEIVTTPSPTTVTEIVTTPSPTTVTEIVTTPSPTTVTEIVTTPSPTTVTEIVTTTSPTTVIETKIVMITKTIAPSPIMKTVTPTCTIALSSATNWKQNDIILLSSYSISLGTINTQTNSFSSTVFLGVISGILLVVLVAVIIGWVATCYATINKRRSHKQRNSPARSDNLPLQRQFDNAIYDGGDAVIQLQYPLATEYSLVGPEHYSSNGRDHQYPPVQDGATYSNLNKDGGRSANGEVAQKLPLSAEYSLVGPEHTSSTGVDHQSPIVLHENGATYNTLNIDEVRTTNAQETAVYETPMVPASKVEDGKEEEYSRLKH